MVVQQGLRSVTIDLLDAVFRPSRYVEARTSTYSISWISQFNQIVGLVSVYMVNLAMYAIPLTLAGFGIQTIGDPPSFFVDAVGDSVASAELIWQFTAAFFQNSAYITAAVLVTLLTYHIGVVLTFNSRGFLQSLHTVVYSSSVYLAGLFSAVWYLTTNPGVEQARNVVRDAQLMFVYSIIDLMGVDLRLPIDRPEVIVVGNFSNQGKVLLALIAILLGYYFYSLYLGSRVNHQMGRTNAVIVLLAVAMSPVLYVAGSIFAATTSIP